MGSGGQTGGVAGFAHPRGFAPLWVYLFGWFAVAVAQAWLLPPGEHSVAFDVGFFAVGATIVAVVLTLAERRTGARR